MDKPSASIIVPLWNGRDYIEDCLAAALSQNYSPLEVIVVDNASSDGSADLVAEIFPTVRLIRNQHNLGFAGGCNTGLRAATGKVLALLNQDTLVAPNWLQFLCAALQDTNIGLAGCKIFYPDGETIQHAGGWIEWPVGEAHHYGHREQDTEKWQQPCEVEYVTGAAMAFRREVLERVGFLDEAFWPGYFEDVDFCLRVWKAGFEIWYIPDATLTHTETTSFEDRSAAWQFYHRGRLRFLLKHIPPDQFLNQFVPAEELHQPAIIDPFGSQPLCRAYLETIARTAPILYQSRQIERETINEVIQALQHLYTMAWAKDWQKTEMKLRTVPTISTSSTDTAKEALSTDVITPLQEFEFQSDIPLIGPLISRFRAAWYSMAAQWAIRHLMQQQELINHQQLRVTQHYIKALEKRLAELADENTFLAGEIAQLQLQLSGKMMTDQVSRKINSTGQTSQ